MAKDIVRAGHSVAFAQNRIGYSSLHSHAMYRQAFRNARLRITELTGKLGGMGSTHSLFKLGSLTSTSVDWRDAKT